MRSALRNHVFTLLCALVPLWFALPAAAEVRVQDVARLQGQRTNKLMGFGVVVGLPGTGDGEKYAPTIRALMRLHERYHAPILTAADIKGNRSVALVAVEAVIPEFGAREGQRIDVAVSAIGSAKSLTGGQLLTTPLQYVLFDPRDESTQHILALAGGAIQVVGPEAAMIGTIPQGATLEEDFFYNFIEAGGVTLVLDDAHAGWPWAHRVALALNYELANPAEGGRGAADAAVALDPRNIHVRIPPWELARPASFISRVLETAMPVLPEDAAVVTINRTRGEISFTRGVTVSPTVLEVPGLGTVMVGRSEKAENGAANQASNAARPVEPVGFDELFETLSAIKATPQQKIDAIEHLHRSGTLHAQIRYE